MNSEEIRIGNWLHHKDNWSYRQPDNGPFKEFDFQWQERDWLGIGESCLDLKIDIEPIPITEEWLSKFGFLKIPNETYINGNQFLLQVTGEANENGSMNRDETWFDGIGDSSWIRKDGLKTMSVNVLCRGNYVCNCANYVHQLQNIYFALTGNELTIKP